MDISGMFNEAGQNTDGNGTTDMAAGVSPVVDVNSLLGDTDTDANANDATTQPATDDNATATDDSQSLAMPDPLNDIVPNETVTTNDSSVVGETKAPDADETGQEPTVEPFIPDPIQQPEIAPLPDPTAIIAPEILPPAPEDPEKVEFIKTYTAEFDESLRRATDAIQNTLDSVDKSIHEKLPDITIPEQANEFLKKAPTDGKVEKFEDVREVVSEIMERANDAKQQSEAAAAEAARIYDEVQTFKHETKQQISELTGDGVI
ncbi:MAG: hypothetical protein ACM3JF_01235 [Sphaerimonospora mesophila]